MNYLQSGVEGQLQIVPAVGGCQLVEVKCIWVETVNESTECETVRPTTA